MRFQGNKKILIAKMRYTGDVLLITPFIKAMRKAFPGSHIGVLVNKGTEDVLFNNPDLDEIITFDRSMGLLAQWAFIRKLKKKKYHSVIDLTSSDRSAWIARLIGAWSRVGLVSDNKFRSKYLYNVLIERPISVHMVDRNLDIAKMLSCKRLKNEPVLNLTDEEIASGAEIVSTVKKPYAVIHPGARRWYKSWPMEHFAGLADRTVALGVDVVIAGGPEDIENAAKIASLMKEKATNIAGKTTVRELAAVIKGASFFVGNDSAPMHISHVLGTRTIALFGPTDWRVWRPIGEEHFVFAKDVDCSPCGHSKECTKKDEEWCMRMITVDEVMEAVELIVEDLKG
jgi:predicted lipopolysaccharide heptosyltransferase III